MLSNDEESVSVSRRVSASFLSRPAAAAPGLSSVKWEKAQSIHESANSAFHMTILAAKHAPRSLVHHESVHSSLKPKIVCKPSNELRHIKSGFLRFEVASVCRLWQESRISHLSLVLPKRV